MHKLTPLRHLLTFTPNNSRVFAIIKDTRRTKIFKWVERDSPELKKYLENYPYPEHYKPSFVEYNGPETLRVAYVLDRNPICTPETHPVQQDMQNLMIENGNYYARHEYTSFTEYWPAWKEAKKKLQGKKNKTEKDRTYLHVKPPPKRTPEEEKEYQRRMGQLEFQDVNAQVLRTWNPAPRYTQADMDDDRHSLNRKLTHRLYLIVKDKETKKWMFPSTIRKNPFNMRLMVQTFLHKQMGHRCAYYFLANHPMAHYVNPEDPNDKTFFYHCLFLKGRPPLKQMEKEYGYEDHAWVTRQEILEYDMVDDHYKEICHKMLWDGYVMINSHLDYQKVKDLSKSNEVEENWEAELAKLENK